MKRTILLKLLALTMALLMIRTSLTSNRVQERQAAIDALISASVFTCPIEVRADNQILLLVTCTEKDQDRRVVAARRIREGEEEAVLKKTVERSWKR